MRSGKKTRLWLYIFISTLLLSSIMLFGGLKKASQLAKLKMLSENHQMIRPIKKTKFSDKVLIKSAIHNFKQSIKNQNHKTFERLISIDIEDSTGVVKNKSEARQKFFKLVKTHDISLRSRYSQRRTPKLRNIKPTWDFEIDITDIEIFKNMGNAIVKCDIYFAMDQPDDIPGIRYAKKPKRVKEKLFLKKENGKWKIQKVNKLFKFMSERKDRLTGWKNSRTNK